MLYPILCKFNDVFGLVVFFIYLAAFVLAFALVFIFPPGALALVLLGLGGLVAVWILMALSRGVERGLSRRSLGTGCCPSCGSELSPPVESNELIHVFCSKCGQGYEEDGRRAHFDEDEESVEDLSAL